MQNKGSWTGPIVAGLCLLLAVAASVVKLEPFWAVLGWAIYGVWWFAAITSLVVTVKADHKLQDETPSYTARIARAECNARGVALMVRMMVMVLWTLFVGLVWLIAS